MSVISLHAICFVQFFLQLGYPGLQLRKVPLGVVLCIPPFNYPVNLAVSKIAPALMAGNAVVGKMAIIGNTTTV